MCCVADTNTGDTTTSGARACVILPALQSVASTTAWSGVGGAARRTPVDDHSDRFKHIWVAIGSQLIRRLIRVALSEQ